MFYVVTFFRSYTPCCRFCFFFIRSHSAALPLLSIYVWWCMRTFYRMKRKLQCPDISVLYVRRNAFRVCMLFFSSRSVVFFSLFVWNKGNDEKRINTIKHTDRRSNNNAHGEEPERKKTRHGQTHKALLKITLLYWACLNNSF